MRNLKLVLAYDGTEFSGWQVQPEAATIQGTLASAVGRVTGENVLPQGSGRTDAGVHALGQVATFLTRSPIPPENLVVALNDILPSTIRVLEAAEAPPNFTPASPPRPRLTATACFAAPSVCLFWHAMCGIIPILWTKIGCGR